MRRSGSSHVRTLLQGRDGRNDEPMNRRSAVRNLERAGVPRSTAMPLVGHRTGSIYTRYAIVDEATLGRGEARHAARSDPERRAPGRPDYPREGERGALGQSMDVLRDFYSGGR